MTVFVKVTITYKDDTKQEFECSATPYVDKDWVTIYPYRDPLSRIYILGERVSEVSVDYAVKEQS